MYGLNAFALICFAAICLASWRICLLPEPGRRRVVEALCIVLLAVRAGIILRSFGSMENVPVEFSSVAYFAVPIIILSRRKSLLSWASYSGLMAGFFYYLTMIAAGGTIYASYPHGEIYISLFSHGTIFVCGYVLASTQHFDRLRWPRFMLGIAAVAANAIIWRPYIHIEGRLLIYELIDAAWVRMLFPCSWLGVSVPAFYVLLAAAVLFSIRMFFHLNSVLCKKNMMAVSPAGLHAFGGAL